MAPSHETMTILYNHILPQTQMQSYCSTLRIFEESISFHFPNPSPTPPKPADLCHHNWKTEHPMSVIAPPPPVDIQSPYLRLWQSNAVWMKPLTTPVLFIWYQIYIIIYIHIHIYLTCVCVCFCYPFSTLNDETHMQKRLGCNNPSLPKQFLWSKLLTMVMVLGMPMPKAWNSNGMDIDTWSQRVVQVKPPTLIEHGQESASVNSLSQVVTIG